MKRESGKKPASKTFTRPESSRNEASRPVRVAAQLRQEVARLVSRDLADPRLEGLVVSNAWISSDLRLAKVYFRIATTSEGAELDARRKDAEKALERASGRLRKAVTSRLGLRVAPELRFVYDEGQDARSRIEQILDEVNRETKPT
ncbi:MAG TPA: 30S ribosome-binding factor RbfA [Labilithrix sp.]|nr:30S ribosome-binding factor RbfA [Labilithrix sp.]